LVLKTANCALVKSSGYVAQTDTAPAVIPANNDSTGDNPYNKYFPVRMCEKVVKENGNTKRIDRDVRKKIFIICQSSTFNDQHKQESRQNLPIVVWVFQD
jgi:hypothetical protein